MQVANHAVAEEFPRRHILEPFDPREAILVAEAALMAGISGSTVRLWCDKFGIGRPVGGRFKISRVALRMLLDGDRIALAAYHSGDCEDPRVLSYFQRCGVPIAGGTD